MKMKVDIYRSISTFNVDIYFAQHMLNTQNTCIITLSHADAGPNQSLL